MAERTTRSYSVYAPGTDIHGQVVEEVCDTYGTEDVREALIVSGAGWVVEAIEGGPHG